MWWGASAGLHACLDPDCRYADGFENKAWAWPPHSRLPSVRDAALTQAATRFQLPHVTAELARVKMILTMVERSMRAEGVPEPTVRRVVNTLVWGHPDGEAASWSADENERANRERIEQVLGDFRPNESSWLRSRLRSGAWMASDLADDLAGGLVQAEAGDTVPAETIAEDLKARRDAGDG